SATIPAGTGFVAAGTGMVSQPGIISLDVPAGASVEAALLYWSVFATEPTVGDDTLSVNGVPVTGTLIGGPTRFFFQEDVWVYRADISGMVGPGLNLLTLTDLTVTDAQFPDAGAGVLAIIDDGGELADLSVYDGNALAFYQFPEPLRSTVPITHTFAADTLERAGELVLFAGSVEPDRANS